MAGVMGEAFGRVMRLCHQHALKTSFLAGCLASLSLPPAYVMPAFLLMGWVFYQAAIAPNWRQSCLHITLGAYGWFLSSLYWISHSLLVGEAEFWFLIPVSFFGIPVIVTAFWAVGGMVGYRLAGTAIGRLVMMAVMIGLLEWGREFIATGFPWNAPGLIFLGLNITASWAAVFGQTGLNFIALFAAIIAPFYSLSRGLVRRQLAGMIMTCFIAISLVILGLASYSHQQMSPLNPADEAHGIRLVQPAVPQADKWVREMRAAHMDRLTSLSIAEASQPIDLVIWPETAFAGDYRSEGALVDARAAMIANFHRQQQGQQQGGAGQLLSGILRFDADNQVRNSALLIAEDGTKALYDKTHLVPFGEYVPWRFIPFIDAIAGPRDFTKGAEVRPLFVPNFGLVLPLICYEAIFPQLAGRARERPSLIVNVTNDGWFGHTAGPYQHLAQTRMTAISYGIAVVRVANGGISAVFDGKGAHIASLGLGEQGFVDTAKPATYRATLFARLSFLINSSLLIVLLMLAIGLDRLGKRRQ